MPSTKPEPKNLVPRELLLADEIARGVQLVHELPPARQAEVRAALKAAQPVAPKRQDTAALAAAGAAKYGEGDF